MARGVRKSQAEKMREELIQVQEAITQYQNSLKTLKEKEAELREKINQEDFREITKVMEDKGITLDDLRQLIETSCPEG